MGWPLKSEKCKVQFATDNRICGLNALPLQSQMERMNENLLQATLVNSAEELTWAQFFSVYQDNF